MIFPARKLEEKTMLKSKSTSNFDRLPDAYPTLSLPLATNRPTLISDETKVE